MEELLLSFTEENYLKSLIYLTVFNHDKSEVGTNELAAHLNLKPATVNDMLKKLKEKKLIHYERYGKISLTEAGRLHGIIIIRKHRLWETFLFEKLEFTWDEVHEVAEQLEHIQSKKLVDHLDAFLDYPKFDPHGDPIPDSNGVITLQERKTLDEILVGTQCRMIGVKDNSSAFLQYLNKLELKIGDNIEIDSIEEYDSLLNVIINNNLHTVSQKFANNIYVLVVDNS